MKLIYFLINIRRIPEPIIINLNNYKSKQTNENEDYIFNTRCFFLNLNLYES